MKKKIILFLILLLLLSILSIDYSYLQEEENEGGLLGFLTGNKYLESTENSKINYIGGSIDMLYYQTKYYNPKLYSRIRETMKDMTGWQVRAIFDKYLEEHPEKWHLSAASLLDQAIMEIILDN